MAKRKLRVGFDFDGVIAYNPFRIIRHPVSLFKRLVLGQKRTRFFVPKTRAQKWIWAILHESSVLPGFGLSLVRKLIREDHIEAYLVTGRFSYLEPSLLRWLEGKRLTHLFKEIHINKNEEQNHHFKKRVLGQLELDAFIEDNLDVVRYLKGGKTKIYWIYNLLDILEPYPHKHPSLHSATSAIIRDFKIYVS